MARATQLDQLPGMENPPDPATVRELGRLGYKEAVVSLWPRSKAVTVLEARLKEEYTARRKAAERDGAEPPPERPVMAAERADAAGYLEVALAKPGKGELHLALSYCSFALDDAEARRVANGFLKLFRGA